MRFIPWTWYTTIDTSICYRVLSQFIYKKFYKIKDWAKLDNYIEI